MQLKLKKFIWTSIILASLVVALSGLDRVDAFAAAGMFNSPAVGNIIALDHFKSAFTVGGKAITSVRFQNNSGSPTVLKFAITDNSAGWEVTLSDSSGLLKLLSPNNYETYTSVPNGIPYTVFVNVRTVLPSLTEGNSTSPKLSVYSGGSISDFSQLRFAIPAPFVYAISDSRTRNSLRLAYLSSNASIEAIELLSFAGNNISVSSAKIGEDKYVLAWENRISLQNSAQNIEFSIYNNVGTGLVHRKTLFDNSASINVDSFPFIAASPNGRFGVLFNRKINNSTTNQIAFQLVDQNGEKVNNSSAPLVIGQENNPLTAPRLIGLPVESGQYRMLAVWYNFDQQLWGASINITNDVVAIQTAASAIADDASWPVILPLSDGRVFLAYNKGVNSILANDMQFDLGQPDPPRSILGSAPIPRGAVQFSNGNILLAWTDNDQVKLSVFDSNVSADPTSVNINFTNIPEPDNVSITLDRQGRAIVFWTDLITKNFLYYALIDSSGTVMTQPMIFRESGGAYEFIISPNGQGIVSLNGLFAQFLPNVSR